jgi:hypothetical protein
MLTTATLIPAFVIYCPHLNRDIRGILKHVHHPRIFTGFPTQRGEDGCLESHKAIIRWARDNDHPAVWVIEDDCEFTPRFNAAQWQADGVWAQANGFGAMTGGVVRTWGAKLARIGLVSVDSFCSAHCMLYLAANDGYTRALAAVQPYDQTLGPALVQFPFVAVQAPSFSGILKRDVNYVPDYWAWEDELRSQLQ